MNRANQRANVCRRLRARKGRSEHRLTIVLHLSCNMMTERLSSLALRNLTWSEHYKPMILSRPTYERFIGSLPVPLIARVCLRLNASSGVCCGATFT